MTGVTSSKRQWASWRVRALTAAILALALLIPLIGTANAQDAQWPPYYGNNRLCIQGRIINFDETPLPFSDLYTSDDPSTEWDIVAISASTGVTIPVKLDLDDNDEPNADAFFTLDEEDGLTTGQWTISITLPPGWEPVDPYKTELTVNLDYGMTDCAKVRFKLRWPVNVVVLKIDDNHVPLEGWTIRAQPAHGNWFASPVEEVTRADGTTEAFRLTAGKWVFTERAPAGTHFKPVIPENGKQELNVDPRDANGDPAFMYELRFKNRIYLKGCLDVYKQDQWPTEGEVTSSFGLPGWKMTVKRLDGTFVASGVTDALGHIVFKNLPFGPYVVTEETRPGWTSDYATSVQVTVAPPTAEQGDDYCTPVTFTNEQTSNFCIEGYKLDANGHVGIPNWEITATPLAKGGFPNPNVDTDANGNPMPDHLTAYTDGSGKFVFGLDDATAFPPDDYRIPGAAYKVCEADVDGWLPHTPKCRTIYLPKKPGACVRVPDFVNQQVGHSEAMAYGPRPSSGGYGCSSTHTVAPGESLFGIGNSYGVSAGAMLAANKWIYGRPNHYVYPGDSVCIP